MRKLRLLEIKYKLYKRMLTPFSRCKSCLLK